MRSLAAFLICIISGVFVEVAVIKICLSNDIIHTSGGSGSFLPSPNLDRFLIVVISGVFGGLYGLFCGVVVCPLARNGFFARLKAGKIIFLTVAFGVCHSGLFALLEYNNARYNKPAGPLEDFQHKIIITTAVIELITGCLIGLASTVASSSLCTRRTADQGEQPAAQEH